MMKLICQMKQKLDKEAAKSGTSETRETGKKVKKGRCDTKEQNMELSPLTTDEVRINRKEKRNERVQETTGWNTFPINRTSTFINININRYEKCRAIYTTETDKFTFSKYELYDYEYKYDTSFRFKGA